jgi:hypothetical protein
MYGYVSPELQAILQDLGTLINAISEIFWDQFLLKIKTLCILFKSNGKPCINKKL